MDDGQVNALFRKQLPFRIEVIGRGVSFKSNHSRRIVLEIDPLPTGYCDDGIRELADEGFRKAFDSWSWRSMIGRSAPDVCSVQTEPMLRLRSEEPLSLFLKHFLKMRLGPRLLVFEKGRGFDDYPWRSSAIDQAFLTWDAVQNYARTKDGALDPSISCAGFSESVAKHVVDQDFEHGVVSRCLCGSATTDASGTCRHHRNPTSRTLFNYYPFFEREGCPKLAEK